jgi:hypothetical protein
MVMTKPSRFLTGESHSRDSGVTPRSNRANPPIAHLHTRAYSACMGYIVVGILILVLLVVLVVTFSGGKPPQGTLPHKKPVGRTEPSSEEPTPGRSSSATPKQQDKAGRHTPPA